MKSKTKTKAATKPITAFPPVLIESSWLGRAFAAHVQPGAPQSLVSALLATALVKVSDLAARECLHPELN